MRIKYIGRHSGGVEVPALDTFVAHGETFDVDDDLGESLCRQQSEWQPVKAAPSKSKTAGDESAATPKDEA